jgi:hypothetical protein
MSRRRISRESTGAGTVTSGICSPQAGYGTSPLSNSRSGSPRATSGFESRRPTLPRHPASPPSALTAPVDLRNVRQRIIGIYLLEYMRYLVRVSNPRYCVLSAALTRQDSDGPIILIAPVKYIVDGEQLGDFFVVLRGA